MSHSRFASIQQSAGCLGSLRPRGKALSGALGGMGPTPNLTNNPVSGLSKSIYANLNIQITSQGFTPAGGRSASRPISAAQSTLHSSAGQVRVTIDMEQHSHKKLGTLSLHGKTEHQSSSRLQPIGDIYKARVVKK